MHPGLVLSTHTNGIWVALSRELVEIVFDFYEWMFENNHFDREFKTVNLGWGIDSVYCALAISLNKKVYRDWKCTIGHTKDQSYSSSKAGAEMRMILQQSLNYAENHGIDKDKMKDLINLIYKKHNTKQPLEVSEVYLNLPKDSELVF
jgi:hypothetical protein